MWRRAFGQRVRAASAGGVDDEHALVGKPTGAAKSSSQQLVDKADLGANHRGRREVHPMPLAHLRRAGPQERLVCQPVFSVPG